MSELCKRRRCASVADSSLSRVTRHLLADAPPTCGAPREHVGVKPFGQLEVIPCEPRSPRRSPERSRRSYDIFICAPTRSRSLGCQRDPIYYHRVKITCG